MQALLHLPPSVSFLVALCLCLLLSFAPHSGLAKPSRLPSRSAPAIFEVPAKNLHPEDCAFDANEGVWYQSILFTAGIHVMYLDGRQWSLSIEDITSQNGTGTYAMSGLSTSRRNAPTRLYAVAKDYLSFQFTADGKRSISPRGPNKFVAYDLPLKQSSQPAWVADLAPVQDDFEQRYGTRPFGPVDSAQDDSGYSYVTFALGAPAIARISPDGESMEAWAFESPDEDLQPRVGYTGITYLRSVNKLIVWGGPRGLTLFDLSSDAPNSPIPVRVDGLDPIVHAEKINLIPSTDGSGLRVLATNAPYIYSFRSGDGDDWTSTTFKRFDAGQFGDIGLTAVCEANLSGARHIYAEGAFFSEGPHSTREVTPMFKLPDSLLTA